MQKILMVCLGNICRSPVAEGIMRKIALDAELEVEIDSAGTSGYHNGENPDPRSVSNAKKNGVDISNLKSRKFIAADFDRFDHILVMDDNNYRSVLQLAMDEKNIKKVDYLLNKLYPGKNKSVPDPYFGGENGFEDVFRLIEGACMAFAEELKKKKQ